MKKLQVPYNLDPSVLEIYEWWSDFISEIFFGLHPDVFPNGRQNEYPPLDEYRQQTIEICERMHKVNIKCMVLLNSDKIIYTNDNLAKIQKELDILVEHGLDGAIIADPIIMEWVHGNYPDLKIRASVLSNFYTLGKLKELESLGYVKEVCLPQDFNRDEDSLKLFKRKTKLSYSSIVNSACRIHCPLYFWHQNDMGSNAVGNNSELMFSIKRLTNRCTLNFLKAPFILPEELEYYDRYYDQFKIEDRSSPTTKLMGVVEAYAMRVNPVNLRDCLSGSCIPPVKEVIPCEFSNDWRTYIRNCKGQCWQCNYCDKIWEEKICQK